MILTLALRYSYAYASYAHTPPMHALWPAMPPYDPNPGPTMLALPLTLPLTLTRTLLVALG